MRGLPRPGTRLRPWASLTEQDWERTPLLVPTDAPAQPELVSDGAGLAFSPSTLHAPSGGLQLGDPAVDALAALLRRQSPGPDGSRPQLQQWRVLARTDKEVLFALGMPPAMVTVAMRYGGRREGWRSIAVTRDAALRVTRDGIRASHWELDQAHPPSPQDTVLRILVTEQTRSGGASADKRLLPPDLYADGDEVMLRVFVTPRPSIQNQITAAAPKTPARVQLPFALGDRRLIDGALLIPS